MKSSTRNGIIFLVLLLAIGFASIATTIIIGGSSTLGFNENDYDIYFSEAVTDEGGSASIDQQTAKTITFSSKTLEDVGDVAILDYTVTNNSDIYDAEGTIELKSLDDDIEDYVEITMIGFEEPTLLKAKSSVSGRIKIELVAAAPSEIAADFAIELHFDAVSRSTKGSDEDEDDPTCVSDGYYLLKCSCDNNQYIAWLDGPYLDSHGDPMNSTRTQDLNYPPANTYICGCSNGQTGYVVNTGEISGTICGIDPPPSIGELVEESPTSIYGYSITNYSATVNQTIPNYVFTQRVGSTNQYVQSGTKTVNETVDEWKLLYYDEEEEAAYIIATNVITNDLIVGNEMRRLFDADQVSMTWETDDPYESFKNYETANNNVMVTGSRLTLAERENFASIWANAMNDSDNWTQFLDGTYGDEAFGGATAELWLNSYNEKYPGYNLVVNHFAKTTYLETYRPGPSAILVTRDMVLDTLYFPMMVKYDGEDTYDEKVATSYYLSTPVQLEGYRANLASAGTVTDWVLNEQEHPYTALTMSSSEENHIALRPIVKLKASVKGIIDHDNKTITLQ